MTSSNLGESQERYFVPGLERGLLLLSEFTRDNSTLTAPELARRLDLPRTTVFRLLVTLEAMGFVTREGNAYRLGMAVLRLGFEYLASLELTELGQPILSALRNETGHACNLVVRDNRTVVYVAKMTPASILSSSVNIGTRLPAHATALGRILLGDLDFPSLEALYPERRLKQFSAGTPRSVSELFDLIQQDRLRGYALSEGYYEAGISTIAAPVRGQDGKLVAALGVTVSAPKVADQELSSIVTKVRSSADELSRLLGHRPKPKPHQTGMSRTTGRHVAGMY